MSRSTLLAEERRGLSLADAGVAITGGKKDPARFGGHAAVFNSRTAIGNPLTYGFYEEISPGAFTKTIGEGDARMLVDHDSRLVVSRVSAGTLSLSQDAAGLAVNSALDTQLSYVGDLVANLRNGNVTGMSFGFQVMQDDWRKEEVQANDGNAAEVEVRTLREVKLVEVSAVTFPAYESTDAGLRSTLETVFRHRGDLDAIDRRLKFRPELAHLLDELPLEEAASDPKKPYGNVTYADPGYQKDGKKRYPLDTKDHCKAAWSYINQAKNAAMYSADQLKAIKGRIKAALNKLGVTVADAKNSIPLTSLPEPGESTREQGSTTDDTEPAETTREPSPAARMRALSARFHLPAA